MDTRVADNDIHHRGVINKFVAGVFLGLSDGTKVQHNAIHDVPHHTINLGSNGYGRNVLEYNDIRRACREIFDTGAINSWADTLDVTRTYVARNVERSGHVIRHNFIGQTWGLAQDERGNLSAGSVTKTRGVYLDDFTDELADGRTAAEHLTLAEWQQRGFDRHSVTGDPDFANPQRADYSLLPDSPAHALGIVGIDQARIGPRSGRAP